MMPLLQRRPRASRPNTLRRRLTWLIISVVGLAVLPIAATLAWQNGERDVAMETARLTATARVVASLASDAATQGDRNGAFRALRAIGQMEDIEYGRVEGRDGALLAETGAGVRLTREVRTGADNATAAPLWQQLFSHTSEVRVPIFNAPDTVGSVTLLGRTEGMLTRFLITLGESLLVACGAILVGLVIAWRLQERIAGPILALSGAMRGVQETYDFRQHVAIPADGEVGELVGGFNRMLSEIQVRDDRIAAQMAGLEDQVMERTAELLVAKEAAEAANSAKSDFLATMSHEIRTPMNGVMVMAEMLAAGELSPRERRFADVIAKSGASLLAIINDILDFSKMEAGKLELESVPVDLSEIVDDVLSLFWDRAAGQQLDLAGYVDPRLPQSIAADPVRLRQILSNLVNNAIKFTETGGVMVEITQTPDNRIEIAVQDSGIGIPNDKITSLFSAFTQADQSTTRRFGGTGLGLAICDRLVHAMDGEWRIDSKIGLGSRFAFAFGAVPLARAADWPDVETRGYTFALCCEGALTHRALRGYLEHSGFELARNAADATLVIADPVGLSTLTTVPDMAICLGTYGDSEPRELMRRGIAHAVLMQPVRRGDLEQLLRHIESGTPLPDTTEFSTAPAVGGSVPSFLGSRVLVVDDSAVNREIAMEALHRFHIEVRVVNDGYEAISVAFAEPFHAILMDASMPGIDGFDAAREIRRLERERGARRVPIVALTAHVLGAAAEAWRDADMDGVLHKPFTLAALSAELGRFLSPSIEETLAKPADVEAAPVANLLPSLSPINNRRDLFDSEVVTQLEAFAGNGRGDFVTKVFRLYIENAPRCLANIQSSAEAGDADAISEASHALKSMSFNIGAKAVAGAAGVIEAKSSNGEKLAPEIARDLGELVRNTVATLEMAL